MILLTILKVIILLGVLVFIHELGHFLVAKKCKVKVLEFSIGFGPQILKKQGKETMYSLRLVPLGGFVNMLGEEERVDDKNSYSNAKRWKKFLILLAGGLVNIIFGILMYFVLASSCTDYISNTVEEIKEHYSASQYGVQEGDKILKINGNKVRLKSDIDTALQESNGNQITLDIERNGENIKLDLIPTPEKTKTIGIYLGIEGENLTTEIKNIYDNTPAQKAGLKAGDIVISIDGKNVEQPYHLVELIQSSNEEITIKVKRENEELEYVVKPEVVTKYYIGVTFKLADKTFKNSMYYGFWDTLDFTTSILQNLKELFSGNVNVNQLTGPIGISNMVAQTQGWIDFIYLLSLISLSLGITNLLPFPPLDGGKILLLGIEAIRRKQFSEKVDMAIQTAGFLLIIVLSVFVTYNDILRIF